jgi:drug/metabolite transporter (DMT)-like permease
MFSSKRRTQGRMCRRAHTQLIAQEDDTVVHLHGNNLENMSRCDPNHGSHMTAPYWLWIPITLWAAFAQTLRNAAQRHLTAELGTVGATSVRFIYGLPFAVLWLFAVKKVIGESWPDLPAEFWKWITLGAITQIAGTALLLKVMAERNFALGVAYSKTEAVQVAIIAVFFLGDRLSVGATIAVVVATLGVILISTTNDAHPVRRLLSGWTTKSAWLGLGAGAGFALSAVGFRGATVSLAPTHYVLSAAITLVIAQCMQSTLLGVWMRLREDGTLTKLFRAWRGSILAGFMGAAATAGWFTAMAIEPIAHVRTLGLIELVFSLVVSRRVFREHLRRIEWIRITLLGCGLILVTAAP